MTNQITHLGAYRKIWPRTEPPGDGGLPSRVHDTEHFTTR